MGSRNRKELWLRVIRELREDPLLEFRLKQIPSRYLEEPSSEAVASIIDRVISPVFLRNGLDEEDEATAYGCHLEDLLDKVNRFRLDPNWGT